MGMIVKRFSMDLLSWHPFEYIENWYAEMSRQGLHYSGDSKFFALFEEGRPEERRYRIIPKSKEEMGEEELGYYREMGWNLVGESREHAVFYACDPGAPEIFTDEDSYHRHTRTATRRKVVELVSSFIWIIVTMLNLYNSMLADGRYHAVDQYGKGLYVAGITAWLLMAVFWSLSVGKGLLWLKHQRSRSGQSGGSSHRKALLLSSWIDLGTMVAVFVSAVILIMTLIAKDDPLVGIVDAEKNMEALRYQGEHPVMLRDFDADAWVGFLENLQKDRDKGSLDCEYSAMSVSGHLSREKAVERAVYQPDDGSSELPVLFSYESLYLQMKNKADAMPYLKEEIRDALWEDLGRKKKLPKPVSLGNAAPGFDYAGYYVGQKENKGVQHLFLKRGDVLQVIKYKGEKDLRKSLDRFQ